ncbi:MAG: hypothetical protein IT165_32385 [Bryobacterales bacterium]|nr:hypothetical protein [Bryobacterales bacterium]
MAELDHYELYYAGKLWGLIPAVYRAEDSAVFDKPGPLRELVNRIAAQAAVLRRSIDRLWEDQSIETCDDWVIPYIADLLATNLVASLDGRGQRLDVAKTIYYRRRKGTVSILEEIAADITGWEARVVEFFRRMGRTRHRLDPPIGLPVERQFPDRLQQAQGLVGQYTHTGIGGWADLRNRYGAESAHTAFDEFAHFADFRLGQGQVGWHNIPRLGVFLWRLKSFGVDQTTPVAVQGCADWYTFDPTGRDIQLFASASRRETNSYGDAWNSPEEWQLPTPVSDALWSASAGLLYPEDAAETVRSLTVYTHPGVAGYAAVNPADVTVYPERGRFRVHNPPVSAQVFGSYHYGFSSTIGAGPYDRRIRVSQTALPQPTTAVSGGGAFTPVMAGTTRIDDSLTYQPQAAGPFATAAVAAKNEKRPVIRMAEGNQWIFEGQPDAELTLEGLLVSGGDVVLRGEFAVVTLRNTTLDPGSSGGTALFATAADGRALRPVHLWVEGKVTCVVVERSITGPIRTRNGGVLEELQITDSIVQGLRTAAPGKLEAVDVKDAASLAAELRDAKTPLTKYLVSVFPAALNTALDAYTGPQPPDAALLGQIVDGLNAVIAGSLLYTAARFEGIALSPAVVEVVAANPSGAALERLNRLLLEEAFPLELGHAAIAMPDGVAQLTRVTVLGRMNVHRLEASECILDDFVVTEDAQRGCVRFTCWATGSVLPRRYECVETRARAPIFASRVFGNAAYAQVASQADAAIVAPVDGSIREGAQNGSEMGAFSLEKNAIKERSLRIKFEEYMPVGLVPVLVFVT